MFSAAANLLLVVASACIVLWTLCFAALAIALVRAFAEVRSLSKSARKEVERFASRQRAFVAEYAFVRLIGLAFRIARSARRRH